MTTILITTIIIIIIINNNFIISSINNFVRISVDKGSVPQKDLRKQFIIVVFILVPSVVELGVGEVEDAFSVAMVLRR